MARNKQSIIKLTHLLYIQLVCKYGYHNVSTYQCINHNVVSYHVHVIVYANKDDYYYNIFKWCKLYETYGISLLQEFFFQIHKSQ